jgi:hemin uptake protein HemP
VKHTLSQPEGIAQAGDWMRVPVHRTIASHELMAGERVIIIRHDNDEYRLRITAAGKLILTK